MDPTSYKWEQSASSRSRWRRRALAGECMWICRPREQHEMFVSGALSLEEDVAPGVLSAAVRSAWRLLRYEVPELGVSACYDVHGQAWMQYGAPRGEDDVGEWVERTAHLECGPEGEQLQLEFEDLRGRVLGMKEGRDEDQAFLFVFGVVEEGLESGVRRVMFMLNFDHQITDGIGARILAGRYLSLLAVALSNPDALGYPVDWEESGKNLSLPWIGVMNENQVVSGSSYEEAMETNRRFIFQQMSTNPGLPLLTTRPDSAIQKTHFITLTPIQSTLLTQTIKTLLTPESTITHLGHASLLLAFLRSNPPSPDIKTLYSPCWLNGRRYLVPPGAETRYIPICLSLAPLVFTSLSDFALDANAGRGEIREVLVRACQMVSREYGKIRERKSVLPGNIAWMEDVGGNMWRKSIIASPSSEEPVRKTADPFFLGDGITEQYIDHSYFSPSMPGSEDRRKVFEVEDVQFAAHAEKNLIVRMSSWRGRTTVSGEWVSCDFDEGMVVRFLEDVVGIMLSILDD